MIVKCENAAGTDKIYPERAEGNVRMLRAPTRSIVPSVRRALLHCCNGNGYSAGGSLLVGARMAGR